MQNKSYHHGDLKNALIEAGIEIVHKEGVQQLSLRKVAAKCGVSHAAPYKHFKDKENLLEAMQYHITDRFSILLNETVEKYRGSRDMLHKLGSAYLNFFYDNPHYFYFVFGQMGIQINLNDISTESYPPFDIFKNAVADILQIEYSSNEYILQNVAGMWAMVHGITAMATMEGIQYSEKWDSLLGKIMRENFIISGE